MVNCEQVRKELSNFIDGEIDLKLRDEIVAHLRGCRRCSVVADTLRKVIYVVGDERVFEVPAGYSERLHRFLDEHLSVS
jgi:anti-sigma factor RsiW